MNRFNPAGVKPQVTTPLESMTKILLTIAAVALTGLISAPRAEAGHSSPSITYRSGCASCGCPVYTRRYVRGYDCHGHPVFAYSRVPQSHGHSCRHRAQHHNHHSRAVISRSTHCSQPRITLSSHRSHGRSSGISFRFSLGGRTCR
ncbi:MAG: hypothetical protein QF706_03040 [Roseibacillus sp.]|nr:hypothetical protein [Roseibacillus sp.]